MALPFGLDIELFRVRIGLAADDASKDVAIEAAVNATVATLENYLGRKLTKEERTQTFTHQGESAFPLDAYPVDLAVPVIVTSRDDPAVMMPDFHVSSESGILYMDWYNTSHVFDVTYTGGYETLPADLMGVILAGFDWFYPLVAGTAQSQAAGVKSVSVPDVGTVSYYESAYAGGGGSNASNVPPAFASTAAMLNGYMRIWA